MCCLVVRVNGSALGEPRRCLRKREPGVLVILALVKPKSSAQFGALRAVLLVVLLEDPSLGILVDSGRGCRTRAVVCCNWCDVRDWI